MIQKPLHSKQNHPPGKRIGRHGEGTFRRKSLHRTIGHTELAENSVLGRAELLLNQNRLNEALALLESCQPRTPHIQNAMAVCLLRLGKARQAVSILRSLVLTNCVIVRQDIPAEYPINLATALLLDYNVSGCLSMLADCHHDDHPAVQQLRNAIKRWRRSFSIWQKIAMCFSSERHCPVQLDFVPGLLCNRNSTETEPRLSA